MSATWILARKQLRRTPQRVVAIVLAALLSAMALMGTGTFVTNMKHALNVTIAAPYTAADIAISGNVLDPQVLKLTENTPQVSAADSVMSTSLSLQTPNRQVTVNLLGVSTNESLRWLHLESGAWPQGTGEVALRVEDARSLGLHEGDTVTASTPGAPQTTLRVSGLVTAPSGSTTGATQVYASNALLAEYDAVPEAIIAKVQPGQSVSATIDTLNKKLTAAFGQQAPTAMTVDSYSAQLIDKFSGGTDVLTTIFLIFVFIALLTATMVIRNTFQVVLAQRLRENGLLRLVGASGRQVQRTVLAEATLIALFGAVAGVAVGYGLGTLISIWTDLHAGAVVFPLMWAVAAFVVTVFVTLLAAWAPAARLRRLSPTAALAQANAATGEATKPRILAWVFGFTITVVGGVTVQYSARNHDLFLFVLAGVVLAIGLIVFVPLLVTELMPLVSAALRPVGPIARIAGENLVRTSRRSATVVLSIALGGSLALAMLTTAQSLQATINQDLAENYPYDALVRTSQGTALDQTKLQPLLTDASVQASSFTASVPVADPEGFPRLTELVVLPDEVQDALAAPLADGQVALSPEDALNLDVATGQPVTFTDSSGASVTLTAVVDTTITSLVDFTSGTSFAAVTNATADEFPAVRAQSNLWLFARDGQVQQLSDAIAQAQTTSKNLQLYGMIATQAFYQQLVTMVTSFVLAMLALTVVISVIGLASVIALAVAQRRRELALLRALGTTRGRVRALVFIEAVSLAVIGGLFSIIIGVPLGIAAITAVTNESISLVITIPWLGIATVIVAAIVFGVIAAARPASVAARIAPAQSLAQV